MGDISHLLSKLILIFSIHRNRSAEGVSLITQALYAAVFCTRYLDLFDSDKPHPAWNVIFKSFYLISSFYILGAMQWMFPRSREREFSWKLGAIVLGGSLVLSPFAMLILVSSDSWGFIRVRTPCFVPPIPNQCACGILTNCIKVALGLLRDT
jgi:hypothetical protein